MNPAVDPSLALEALRRILLECDPNQDPCPLRTTDVSEEWGTNEFGNLVRTSDRRVVTHGPCRRPKGHEGACSERRPTIVWPGHEVLSALVHEVMVLREYATFAQTTLRSQESELRKWRTSDVGGERLASMREQYERSNPREVASKVAYIAALTHALGHAQEEIAVLRAAASAWSPVTDAVLEQIRTHAAPILLRNAWSILGQFSGVQVSAENGTTWFIDDALYDGDDEPTHWIALPPVSR